MPQPQACPDDSTLRDFLHDGLAGADAERLDDHIGGCPACQRALDRLVGSLPGRWFPVTAGPKDDAPGEYASTASPGAMPRDLPSDGEPGAIPGPAARPGPAETPTVADRPARLHLFGEVARGGMGVILRGRDAALGRDLAVKLLLERHRNNPELIRRFVMEARIAGQLQHPGMVPVHEFGALDDGRPYFAMKLVKGRTMEALLKERNDPSADLPRFLGIFEQVCQTVAYAHARGVIHRDLKPSNVMVGRFGEVQVMDWGLAKVLADTDAARAGDEAGDGTPGETRHEAGSGALGETRYEAGDAMLGETRHASGDLTHHGSVLGTWAYMPPEQARGLVAEVDRRSDVFGLGAVLCEILTGQPPYTGSAAESVQLQAMEARLDEASARLGACGADPELIRLAMRCLAPDRAERPADGGEVASAISEYRSGVQERLHQERLARERQEVRAAEARRRQRAWAAATLGVLLALTLGVVTSTIFALGQRAARQRATQQALMAEESLFLLEDVLAQADPQSEANRDITLRQALDRTTDRLKGGRLKDGVKTPESNARMRIALGKIYFNLGEYRQSRDLFAEAHRIARDELGETHPTAMTALDQLGKAHMFLEEFADAERVLTRAYELQRKVLGPDHEDTVHTHAKLADLYGDMGKLDRAREIGESVLGQRRRLWGDEYEFTLVSMNNLGVVYRDLDRPADALPLFEEAERIAMRTRGEDHPATLAYKYNRALALAQLGRREEALRPLSECLAAERRILGESHPATLKTEFGIATLLFKMGQHAESIRISESILGRLGTRIAGDHSFRGNVLVNLGRCFTATGRYPEAERALREAQAIFSKKVGPEHRFSRDAAKALAELLERKVRPQAEEGDPCETPISSS